MKNRLFVLLTSFLMIIPAFAGLKGDLDGNGIIDVEDVNAAINLVLKLANVNDYSGSADLDGNGIIDVEDVNKLINIVLKLEEPESDDEYSPSITVGLDKKIDNYWNENKDLTRYTVRVPNAGQTDPATCTFFSNLNAPFRTRLYNDVEVIDVSPSDPDGIIKQYIYQFHESMNGLSLIGVDGKVYTFRVNTTGFKSYLYAKTGSVEKLIAEITNENNIPDEDGRIYPYTIELKKHVDFAENLLNTNNLIVRIGIMGYACCNEQMSVPLYFVDAQGKKTPYYQAKLMRPVSIDTRPAEYFQDAVDFGEPGSYIDLWDLLDPYDWRGRKFTNYTNYWFYYGCDGATTEAEAFNINDILEDIQISYNSTDGVNGTWLPLPTNVVVQIVPTIAGMTPHGGLGFLTYRANDVYLEKDMWLRVKFSIEYGWGKYVSEWVSIVVKSTGSL